MSWTVLPALIAMPLWGHPRPCVERRAFGWPRAKTTPETWQDAARQALALPHTTDWVWRPDLWRSPTEVPNGTGMPGQVALASGVTLFHDATAPDMALHQTLNPGTAGGAPYGLALDVAQFDGGYLSLALDLPDAAAQGLSQEHILQLDYRLEMDAPREVFARINVQCGPNIAQLVRTLPKDDNCTCVAFDLAYTDLNPRRIDKLWLDLIFAAPGRARLTLCDLVFSRRLRAAF